MTPEWKNLLETKNKSVYKLKMLEQYIGYIKKDFNYDTVFKHLEEVGVNGNLKWSVHKLLFHNLDDKDCIEFLIKAAEEYVRVRIDDAIAEYNSNTTT